MGGGRGGGKKKRKIHTGVGIKENFFYENRKIIKKISSEIRRGRKRIVRRFNFFLVIFSVFLHNRTRQRRIQT